MGQHGVRVIDPAAEGAVAKGAVRLAVPGIVETQEGATAALRPCVQRGCLVARHVGHKAAEKHDAGFGGVGTARRQRVIGEPLAIGPGQVGGSGGGHGGLRNSETDGG